MKSASPYRMVSAAFGLMILVGTVLLMLPVARSGAQPWPNDTVVAQFGPALPGGAPVSVALFTATSAACVTGLIIADTATYWSTFGQIVIMLLIQIGGLGTMTVASFLALKLKHQLTLRQRAQVAVAVNAETQKDLAQVLAAILRIAVITQVVAALALAVRFWLGYGYGPIKSLWYGLFHASSAYNNAGFALYTDSFMSVAHDPWILGIIAVLIIFGGLGFPVIIELLRDRALRTLHSRLVVRTTVLLLAVGTAFFAFAEWTNPATLGKMPVPVKLMNALFASVSPRTAGFNSIDLSQMHSSSWFFTDFLMFIGAGSAGTAGGIKVTTLAVAAAVTWANVRGTGKVHIMRWRLAERTQGQVVTLLGLSVTLVAVSTIVLMGITPFQLDQCLFEAVSALGTVGLTTGITPALPVPAQLVIVLLMPIGRLGPVTLASALAMRSEPLLYDRPAASPLIG